MEPGDWCIGRHAPYKQKVDTGCRAPQLYGLRGLSRPPKKRPRGGAPPPRAGQGWRQLRRNSSDVSSACTSVASFFCSGEQRVGDALLFDHLVDRYTKDGVLCIPPGELEAARRAIGDVPDMTEPDGIPEIIPHPPTTPGSTTHRASCASRVSETPGRRPVLSHSQRLFSTSAELSRSNLLRSSHGVDEVVDPKMLFIDKVRRDVLRKLGNLRDALFGPQPRRGGGVAGLRPAAPLRPPSARPTVGQSPRSARRESTDRPTDDADSRPDDDPRKAHPKLSDMVRKKVIPPPPRGNALVDIVSGIVGGSQPKPQQKPFTPAPPSDPDVQGIFSMWAKGRDKITFADLCAALGQSGLDTESLLAILKQYDKDGDGALGLGEFAEMLHIASGAPASSDVVLYFQGSEALTVAELTVDYHVIGKAPFSFSD